MVEQEPLKAAAGVLELETVDKDPGKIRHLIIERVRELIHSDFQKLVNLLYRMDVHEEKLRFLLEQHPEMDSAELIATMIIDRQVEKIKTRNSFKPPPAQNDEERW